ncbi:MAG: hypothetical protein ACYTDT_00240 [Planctomycetota bacterium]
MSDESNIKQPSKTVLKFNTGLAVAYVFSTIMYIFLHEELVLTDKGLWLHFALYALGCAIVVFTNRKHGQRALLTVNLIHAAFLFSSIFMGFVVDRSLHTPGRDVAELFQLIAVGPVGLVLMILNAFLRPRLFALPLVVYGYLVFSMTLDWNAFSVA